MKNSTRVLKPLPLSLRSMGGVIHKICTWMKKMKLCSLISCSGVFFSVLLLILHIAGIYSDSVVWAFLPYLTSLVLLAVLLPWQVNKYQCAAKCGNEEEE